MFPIPKTTVPVLFRRLNYDGGIVALFPSLPAHRPGSCLSYDDLGGFGGANYARTIGNSRPATEIEAKKTLDVLEAIGYNLRVVKRARAIKKIGKPLLKDHIRC